jgi:urease accessory protein
MMCDLAIAADQAAPDSAATVRSGWDASLRLAFERRERRTVLAHVRHEGPLRFQKPLYPEGDEVCHGIVLHPPAGIAGGDRLSLHFSADAGAHALLTTPGAGKWYRSAGAEASQQILIELGADAAFEWLPQETIVFDGALARMRTEVKLAAGARFIGQELVCLGRIARGERFSHGRILNDWRITRERRTLWRERSDLEGDDALLGAKLGLGGAPVFGTLVAADPAIDAALIAACRDIAPAVGRGAITRLPGILLARYIGPECEAGRHWFAALWNLIRPALLARAAHTPRIWNT